MEYRGKLFYKTHQLGFSFVLNPCLRNEELILKRIQQRWDYTRVCIKAIIELILTKIVYIISIICTYVNVRSQHTDILTYLNAFTAS